MVRPADIISKSIAVGGVVIVVLMFTIAAYLDSFLQGKIDKNIFTISQALAFGNRPAMITLLSIGMFAIGYLIYYRGHRYMLPRLFLVLVMLSLIITIMWVTTFYNPKDHYSIALSLFFSNITLVILNSMAIYKDTNGLSLLSKVILILLPILAILGFIVLNISKIPFINKKVPQLFPSFENYSLAIQGGSIITLGFI
jgi:hypothetical protein